MARAVRSAATVAMAVALVWIAWPRAAQTSLHALLRPLAPYSPIPGVTGGYTLSEAAPGHEGDLVLAATGGAQRIEIHILDRGSWPEAAHTPSFDVGYEVYGTHAPASDVAAVMTAVVDAVRANDPGNLRVADLARRSHTPSTLERILDRLRGGRGFVAGGLLVGVSVLLAQSSAGYCTLALLLAGLGLWLRATSLGLPFALDLDVQQLFTAHLPLLEGVWSTAFHNRHPPLMFLPLHAVQRWGQSEVVVRLPAVIAGTLIGPAILIGARWIRAEAAQARPPRYLAAVCAALAATASPIFIDRSREVTELALFGLLAVLTVAVALRANQRPTAVTLAVVAVGHALLFWTYYLAVFALVGFWLAMWALGPLERRVVRAAALGTLVGFPSLVLAGLTLLRDYSARMMARAYPQVVWGERHVMEIAAEIGGTVVSTVGAPLAIAILCITVVAVVRRDRAVAAPIVAATSVAVAMVLLVGAARIQPYYIVCALPLLLLGLASMQLPTLPRARWAVAALLATMTAAATPRLLANDADRIYSPDPGAFGPRFAQLIASRPEARIALAFGPDVTLLAYYLTRASGMEIDWRNLRDQQVRVEVDGLRQEFVPLLQPGTMDEGSGQRALARLEELAIGGDFLAVADSPPADRGIGAWLERCTELDRTSGRRLVYCSAPIEPASVP